jgi:NADP-dependent 3-hydroxy acid dehydrogenase YdfG
MIDVNIKGVLYGIAAALPVFRKQGFGPSRRPMLM